VVSETFDASLSAELSYFSQAGLSAAASAIREFEPMLEQPVAEMAMRAALTTARTLRTIETFVR
jgi:hypothetical protein